MPTETMDAPEQLNHEAPWSADGDTSEVDLIGVLLTLARRKRLITAVTFACVGVAGVAALILPSWYTGKTSILPPRETQSTASMLMSHLAGTGLGSLASMAGQDLGIKNPNDLYVGMLRSRTVADALINRFELAKIYESKRFSDARQTLADHSDIASDKDGLIRVAVEDKDPARAAALANAYIEELGRVLQTVAVTEAARRRAFFERELSEAKGALTAAEESLKSSQQASGVVQIDSQARVAIEAIARVRGYIAAKEVQLRSLEAFATDQNPKVILVKEELAALRGQLADLQRRRDVSATDLMLSTANVPQSALEYVRRLRQVKYREAVFEMLAKQFEAAKLDEAKEGALVQVLDRAVQPDKRSSPKRAFMVAFAGLAGFFAAIVYCFGAAACNRHRREARFANQFEQLRTALIPARRKAGL